MIGYITLLWALLSGVCAYASLMHLQVGLRKPVNYLHMIFGLLALVAALAIFGNTQLATARTPAQYQRAIWFASVTFTLLYGLVPWFVTLYANEPKRIAALFVSVLYLVVLCGNLLHPYSMLLVAPPEISLFQYPWGEVVIRTTTPPTMWLKALWISHVALIAYLAYACAGLFRRGPTTRAWWLLVATAPFAITLTLNLLVYLGALRLPFTAAFGFVAMLIVMSVALTNEFRNANRQMQNVLDNVPAVIHLKNADGRYRFVNRQFEQLYGIATGAALGKTDAELFDATRATQQQATDLRVLSIDQLVESEFTLLRDKQVHTFASIQFALRNDDGSAYALCGIATDITDRKAAADVQHELTVNLERRVARRTRDLAEVNRELETFAYSVSHDLRAPLMTVHGFADLLLRDYAPSLEQNAQKYVQRIRDGAKRMTGLIEDLLSLSRVTRTIPQRTVCNLSTIAYDAVHALQESDPSRPVNIDIATDLLLQADANLLAVVMSNLLSNAWKYTSKRSDAHIAVGSVQQADETIYFVRDNGAGFDPRYMDKLFQPFKRLHSEQEFPGNGIGLATVARILRRHGGRIWAEGKLQAGATFYFTVPAADETADDVSAAVSATESATSEPHSTAAH